eukprot:1145381-Pelagomonas_calceolata.AAC.10
MSPIFNPLACDHVTYFQPSGLQSCHLPTYLDAPQPNASFDARAWPQTSLIKQAFEALVVNEFRGTTFEPDAEGKGMTDGQQVRTR